MMMVSKLKTKTIKSEKRFRSKYPEHYILLRFLLPKAPITNAKPTECYGIQVDGINMFIEDFLEWDKEYQRMKKLEMV